MRFDDPELDHTVEVAALRLVGIPEEEAADVMAQMVAGFEAAMRAATPKLSATEVEALRGLFIGQIGFRVQEMGLKSGGALGTA